MSTYSWPAKSFSTSEHSRVILHIVYSITNFDIRRVFPENIHTLPQKSFGLNSPTPLKFQICITDQSVNIFEISDVKKSRSGYIL